MDPRRSTPSDLLPKDEGQRKTENKKIATGFVADCHEWDCHHQERTESST